MTKVIQTTTDKLDTTQISFDEPIIYTHAKIVPLKYKKLDLRIKLPTCKLSYNASDYQGDTKFKTIISINKSMEVLHSKILAIDDMVVKYMIANSKKMLDKKPNDKLITSMFKPTLVQNNSKFPPVLNMKIPYTCKCVVDDKPIILNISNLPTIFTKGSMVDPIISISVWINSTNTKYGITYTMYSANVKPLIREEEEDEDIIIED